MSCYSECKLSSIETMPFPSQSLTLWKPLTPKQGSYSLKPSFPAPLPLCSMKINVRSISIWLQFEIFAFFLLIYYICNWNILPFCIKSDGFITCATDRVSLILRRQSNIFPFSPLQSECSDVYGSNCWGLHSCLICCESLYMSHCLLSFYHS